MKRNSLAERQLRRLSFIWFAGGALATAAIVLLWMMLIAAPLNRHCYALEQGLEESKRLLSEQAAIDERLRYWQDEVVCWQPDNQWVSKAADASHDVADFLQWVHQQAQVVGMTIRDFEPTGSETVLGYKGKRIRLVGNGSYTVVCRFMEEMRHCPHMHRITKLEIIPASEDGTECSLTFQLLLLAQ